MKKDIKINRTFFYETKKITNLYKPLDLFSFGELVGSLFVICVLLSIFSGLVYVVTELKEKDLILFMFISIFFLTFLIGVILIIFFCFYCVLLRRKNLIKNINLMKNIIKLLILLKN